MTTEEYRDDSYIIYLNPFLGNKSVKIKKGEPLYKYEMASNKHLETYIVESIKIVSIGGTDETVFTLKLQGNTDPTTKEIDAGTVKSNYDYVYSTLSPEAISQAISHELKYQEYLNTPEKQKLDPGRFQDLTTFHNNKNDPSKWPDSLKGGRRKKRATKKSAKKSRKTRRRRQKK